MQVVHLAHWVRSGYFLNRSLEAKRLMTLSIPNYQPDPGEFLLRIRMTKKLVRPSNARTHSGRPQRSESKSAPHRVKLRQGTLEALLRSPSVYHSSAS